ncbi:protein Shroom2 isoform X4 [Lampetra planeri]
MEPGGAGSPEGLAEVALFGGAPWGFTLKGGLEHGEALTISKVEEGGKADLASALCVGDEVVVINGIRLSGLRQEAICLVKGSHKTLRLSVRRRSDPVSRPHSWHSTKHEEDEEATGMMRISQGSASTAWHPTYHTSSSTSDLSGSYDMAGYGHHLSPDQYSSRGSMDSLDHPTQPSQHHQHLHPHHPHHNQHHPPHGSDGLLHPTSGQHHGFYPHVQQQHQQQQQHHQHVKSSSSVDSKRDSAYSSFSVSDRSGSAENVAAAPVVGCWDGTGGGGGGGGGNLSPPADLRFVRTVYGEAGSVREEPETRASRRSDIEVPRNGEARGSATGVAAATYENGSRDICGAGSARARYEIRENLTNSAMKNYYGKDEPGEGKSRDIYASELGYRHTESLKRADHYSNKDCLMHNSKQANSLDYPSRYGKERLHSGCDETLGGGKEAGDSHQGQQSSYRRCSESSRRSSGQLWQPPMKAAVSVDSVVSSPVGTPPPPPIRSVSFIATRNHEKSPSWSGPDGYLPPAVAAVAPGPPNATAPTPRPPPRGSSASNLLALSEPHPLNTVPERSPEASPVVPRKPVPSPQPAQAYPGQPLAPTGVYAAQQQQQDSRYALSVSGGTGGYGYPAVGKQCSDVYYNQPPVTAESLKPQHGRHCEDGGFGQSPPPRSYSSGGRQSLGSPSSYKNQDGAAESIVGSLRGQPLKSASMLELNQPCAAATRYYCISMNHPTQVEVAPCPPPKGEYRQWHDEAVQPLAYAYADQIRRPDSASRKRYNSSGSSSSSSSHSSQGSIAARVDLKPTSFPPTDGRPPSSSGRRQLSGGSAESGSSFDGRQSAHTDFDRGGGSFYGFAEDPRNGGGGGGGVADRLGTRNVISAERTPMLHHLTVLGAAEGSSRAAAAAATAGDPGKQVRRSDRFATTLRNEIQMKRAQLQKSKSSSQLVEEEEEEEENEAAESLTSQWKGESAKDELNSPLDAAYGEAYKEHVKEAQTKVLRATSFRRRDLEIRLPFDSSLKSRTLENSEGNHSRSSSLSNPPLTRSQLDSAFQSTESLPAHHVPRICGRKRLTDQQKKRSYSEPEKMNEVGVGSESDTSPAFGSKLRDGAFAYPEGSAALCGNSNGDRGSVADRRKFFEKDGSKMSLLQRAQAKQQQQQQLVSNSSNTKSERHDALKDGYGWYGHPELCLAKMEARRHSSSSSSSLSSSSEQQCLWRPHGEDVRPMAAYSDLSPPAYQQHAGSERKLTSAGRAQGLEQQQPYGSDLNVNDGGFGNSDHQTATGARGRERQQLQQPSWSQQAHLHQQQQQMSLEMLPPRNSEKFVSSENLTSWKADGRRHVHVRSRSSPTSEVSSKQELLARLGKLEIRRDEDHAPVHANPEQHGSAASSSWSKVGRLDRVREPDGPSRDGWAAPAGGARWGRGTHSSGKPERANLEELEGSVRLRRERAASAGLLDLPGVGVSFGAWSDAHTAASRLQDSTQRPLAAATKKGAPPQRPPPPKFLAKRDGSEPYATSATSAGDGAGKRSPEARATEHGERRRGGPVDASAELGVSSGEPVAPPPATLEAIPGNFPLPPSSPSLPPRPSLAPAISSSPPPAPSPSLLLPPQQLTDRPPTAMDTSATPRIESFMDNNKAVKMVPVMIIRSESKDGRSHQSAAAPDSLVSTTKPEPSVVELHLTSAQNSANVERSAAETSPERASTANQEAEEELGKPEKIGESSVSAFVSFQPSRSQQQQQQQQQQVVNKEEEQRQQEDEDRKTEQLAKEIVGKDRSLADVLAPGVRTARELMEGIFPHSDPALGEALQARRKSQPRGSGAAKAASDGAERREEAVSPTALPPCPAYYSVSAPKAELLMKMKDLVPSVDDDADEEIDPDLTEKKAELIASIGRKLRTLREARELLLEDVRDNEELGREVEGSAEASCKPNELDKFRMFVGDLDKVVSLLLSLAGRLARVDNAINSLGADATAEERQSLVQKRKLLCSQHEDARELKENLDRRERAVDVILAQHLSAEQLQDYRHFVKMKSALIIERRELDDKIKLGEEQLRCLRESMPPECRAATD